MKVTLAYKSIHRFFILYVLIFFTFSIDSFAQATRTSIASGNWNQKSSWDCNCIPADNDNAIITNGFTLRFVPASNRVNNLTINEGGIVDDNGQDITITGDLTLDGILGGSGIVSLTGINKQIGGKGTITNTSAFNITNNKTIVATAELTKLAGDIVLSSNTEVINNGIFTSGGNILGTATSSVWTNASSTSVLNIGGAPADPNAPNNVPLLLTGTLNASATGNTINYYSSVPITLKVPSVDVSVSGLPAYFNLTVGGSNLKTLPGAEISVNGDLTINSNLNADAANKILHVRGNWINNSGSFTEGFGTVIFDGTSDQSISCSLVTETFNHFTLDKNNGSLNIKVNVKVGSSDNIQSILSLKKGYITTGSYKLTLGSLSTTTPINASNYSGSLDTQPSYTGSIVGTFERGVYNSAAVGGVVLFPLGTVISGNVYRRPLLFTISSIAFSGTAARTLTAAFSTNYPGNAGLPIEDLSLPLPDQEVKNTIRDGYWTLTKGASISSASYNVDLTGEGFTGFVIDSETRVLIRPATVNDWELEGEAGFNDVINKTVKRTGLSTLSAEFALGDNSPCDAPTTTDITGLGKVCKDQPGVTYSVDDALSTSSYLWTVNGGEITGGNGTNSIIVTWGSVGMIGSVSVIENNDCTQGETKSLPVFISPVPPLAITGKTGVAAVGALGTTLENYSITPSPETYDDPYIYSWLVNSLGTIPTSNIGTTISVKWIDPGAGTVTLTTTDPGCVDKTSVLPLPVTVYKTIKSRATGGWNATTTTTWDCNCVPTQNNFVVIRNGHNVTINLNNGRSVKNILIEAGGILTVGTTGTSRVLNVYGQLTINGTLAGIFPVNLLTVSTPSDALVDGSGSITNTSTLNFKGSNRTIFSSTELIKNTGNIVIDKGITVFNRGKIFLNAGGITEGTGTGLSKWINEESSRLEIGGTLSPSQLEADAVNNTIVYTGANPQTIKTPENSGQYFNLSFTGAGIKTLPNTAMAIKGDFSNDSPMISGTGSVDFNGISNILGNQPPNFYDLKISGLLNSSGSNVNVAGNFIHDGVFNANGGTVTFNGVSTSGINGNAALTTFQNITSSNAAGVSVNKAVDLLGVLNVTTGTFDADGSTGNSVFSLRSLFDSPVQDASIAPLLGGAQVSGNVRIERYMSGEGRIYRYIASPVTNSKVIDWQDDFPITGNFTGRSTSPSPICGLTLTRNPSMYWFNETLPGTAESQRYVPYPEPNADNLRPLVPGRGYAAFVRWCNTPTIIDVRGSINQGEFDFTSPGNTLVTFTDHGQGFDGYNLIGNPYPSAISWSSAEWTKTNISPVISIMDNGTGIMRYFDGVDPDEFNGIISAGQGFWVRATAADPVLKIREGGKTSAPHSFYRQSANSGTSSMTISLTENGLTDKAFVKVRKDGQLELDSWDAPKLNNEVFNLATVTPQGTYMAINAIPAVYEGMLVPLTITDMEDGLHTLKIDGMGDFTHYQVELTDGYFKEKKILNWGDVYEFNINKRDDKSTDANRFSLRLVKPGTVIEEKTISSLSGYPNPVNGLLTIELKGDISAIKTITIFNNLGGQMEEINIESGSEKTQIDFTSYPAGLYLIRVVGSGYTRWTKVIKN